MNALTTIKRLKLQNKALKAITGIMRDMHTSDESDIRGLVVEYVRREIIAPTIEDDPASEQAGSWQDLGLQLCDAVDAGDMSDEEAILVGCCNIPLLLTVKDHATNRVTKLRDEMRENVEKGRAVKLAEILSREDETNPHVHSAQNESTKDSTLSEEAEPFEQF